MGNCFRNCCKNCYGELLQELLQELLWGIATGILRMLLMQICSFFSVNSSNQTHINPVNSQTVILFETSGTLTIAEHSLFTEIWILLTLNKRRPSDRQNRGHRPLLLSVYTVLDDMYTPTGRVVIYLITNNLNLAV